MDRSMNLTDIIFTAAILLILVVMIVSAIINFIIETKCTDLAIQYRFMGGSCWGMKGCGKDNCRLRRFCYIYRNAITPEVVAELENMLDKNMKKSGTENQI